MTSKAHKQVLLTFVVAGGADAVSKDDVRRPLELSKVLLVHQASAVRFLNLLTGAWNATLHATAHYRH